MTTPGIRRAYRTLRVEQPAAGADWSITPGGQRWWRIISFAANLTTSIAAGNRRPRLEADSGGHIWARLPVAADQGGFTLVTYTGHTATTRGGIVDGTQMVELPAGGLLLAPGDRLRSITGALDAGDQWSAIVLRVEEIPSGLTYEGDQLTSPPPTTLE